MILKRRFSATQFWEDISTSRATMFVYIGELCRYLVNQAPRMEEQTHSLRLAFGNGLRQEVWERMLTRFNIPWILEFYGATEGNVSMFNYDGKPGAIGRIPSYLRRQFNVKLVQFDIETETPVRNAQGFCVEAKAGQVGEAIGAIGAAGTQGLRPWQPNRRRFLSAARRPARPLVNRPGSAPAHRAATRNRPGRLRSCTATPGRPAD